LSKKEIFTEEQLHEIVRLKNSEHLSSRVIAAHFGCSKSTINNFLSKEKYKEFWEKFPEPVAAGTNEPNHPKTGKFDKKRYVFTAAQNNTYVNKKFFHSLMHYCSINDAELVVSTFLYNKNGFQNGEGQKNVWYDPLIVPFINNEKHEVFDGLVYCGELNILPTAVNPLSGFHSYTKNASAIIPHVKVQLESIPVPKGTDPKILYTTGAITKLNYIQQKVGQIAEFHHIFGALVAEVDDEGDWFVRQLISDKDGCFYDLGEYYTPDGFEEDQKPVEAINWGDIHAEHIDPLVKIAAFSQENHLNMLDVLKPKFQLSHDTINFTARSPHSFSDHYFRFSQFHHGTDSVEEDLRLCGNVLKEMQRPFSQIVVVNSNHDIHFKKWLSQADYKTDPVNAIFFLKCQLALYQAIERGDNNFSIFEYSIKEMFPELKDIRFLKQDEKFQILGIEMGQHGHLGSNGSKGSTTIYRKIGLRYNIGHQHSAGIKDGVYVAGTFSEMDMGYNAGNSSWSQSCIVTYPNSKRTIVTIRNGKWRAF
jgi:hypothetical protein